MYLFYFNFFRSINSSLLNIYSFLTLLSSIHFLRSFDFEMVSSERHWNHLNWFNGQLENMSWLENPLKRFAVPFLNITNKRTEKYQLLAVRLENAPNVRCWFFFFIWVRMVWLCAYEPLTIGMHVVGWNVYGFETFVNRSIDRFVSS